MAEASAFSEDKSAPVLPAETIIEEVSDDTKTLPQAANEAVIIERKTTRRELFEEMYAKYQSLPRYKRKAAILKEMRPHFKDEDGARLYVDTQMSRKLRNLIARRVRMTRKVNLQEFNYFVMVTYFYGHYVILLTGCNPQLIKIIFFLVMDRCCNIISKIF